MHFIQFLIICYKRLYDMPIHSIWLISNIVSLETTLNMYVAF